GYAVVQQSIVPLIPDHAQCERATAVPIACSDRERASVVEGVVAFAAFYAGARRHDGVVRIVAFDVLRLAAVCAMSGVRGRGACHTITRAHDASILDVIVAAAPRDADQPRIARSIIVVALA